MITSLYISDTTIKVVMGNCLKDGSFSIEKIYLQNVSKGAVIDGVIKNREQLEKNIRTLCNDNNLKLKNIDLIIDSSNILIRPTSAPSNISRKDLLTIIRKEYRDFNTDMYSFGFAKIKDNGKETSVFLGFSVPCDFIKSYTDMFKSLGISVSRINSSVNALIQLSGLMSDLSNKTYILTVLSGNVIMCALFVNGEYYFSNRARLINERESFQLENEIEGFISSFIQYSQSEKNGTNVTDIYFCGLHPSENDIIKRIENTINAIFERIKNNLRISAQILPNTPEFAGNTKQPFILADYVYNAGGLVRQTGVNFRPARINFNKNSKTFKILNNIYPAVIAIILLLVINAGVSDRLTEASLNYNQDNMQAERTYLEIAVPMLSSEYETLNILSEKCKGYRQISENISDILENYCNNTKVLSVNYNSSENILSISCKCTDINLISKSADTLYSSGYFEKINYDGYRYTDGFYEYTLSCKFHEIQSGGAGT